METFAFNIGKACVYGIYLFLMQLEDSMFQHLDDETMEELDHAIVLLRMILDPPSGMSNKDQMEFLGYSILLGAGVIVYFDFILPFVRLIL